MALDDVARLGTSRKVFRLIPPARSDTIGPELAQKLQAQQGLPEFSRMGIQSVNHLRIPSSRYIATCQIQVTTRIANAGQISSWLSRMGLKAAVYQDSHQVYCADVPLDKGTAHLEFYRVI